jgi:hypothetical protein
MWIVYGIVEDIENEAEAIDSNLDVVNKNLD